MTTESSKKKDEAVEYILKAHNALYSAIHPDTYGSDDWSKMYYEDMFNIMTDLFEMHKILKS